MVDATTRERAAGQTWLAEYPIDDIKILVWVMNDDGDVEVLIREDLDVQLDETGCNGWQRNGGLPDTTNHGRLIEDKHFAVLHGDWEPVWCDWEQLELGARLAKTFGLQQIADEWQQSADERLANGSR